MSNVTTKQDDCRLFIRPHKDGTANYEDYYWEVIQGLVSVSIQYSINQIGTATISLFVPVADPRALKNAQDKILKVWSPNQSVDPTSNMEDMGYPNFCDRADIMGNMIRFYPILDDIRMNCLFAPMDKVKVFMKQRFQPESSESRYCQAFEGLIDEVNISYGEGSVNITITCSDLQKWLDISMYNVNPAVDASLLPSITGQRQVTFLQSNLQGLTSTDIIRHLITPNENEKSEVGIKESDFIIKQNTLNLQESDKNKKSFWLGKDYELVVRVDAEYEKIIDGKKEKVAIGSAPVLANDNNLKALMNMKQESGKLTRPDALKIDTSSMATANTPEMVKPTAMSYYIKVPSVRQICFFELATKSRPNEFDTEQITLDIDFRDHLYIDPQILDYKAYNEMLRGSFDLWYHKYQKRIEIIRGICGILETEFYMENNGDLIYKPPYYNYNPGKFYKVKEGEPRECLNGDQYLIPDSEILTYSTSEKDSTIVNYFMVSGEIEYLGAIDIALMNTSIAWDSSLIRKFGVRMQEKKLPILGDQTAEEARLQYARSFMNRRNALYRGAALEVPLRPEMQMGRTIALIGTLWNEWQTKDYSMLKKTDVQMCKNLQRATGTFYDLTKFKNINEFTQDLATTPEEQYTNIMVFYVSGMSHNYQAGGFCSTSLTLTHGRRWSDFFGQLNYTLEDKLDSDATNEYEEKIYETINQFSTEINKRLVNINSDQYYEAKKFSVGDYSDAKGMGANTQAFSDTYKKYISEITYKTYCEITIKLLYIMLDVYQKKGNKYPLPYEIEAHPVYKLMTNHKPETQQVLDILGRTTSNDFSTSSLGKIDVGIIFGGQQ